jgi:hypothetical protein
LRREALLGERLGEYAAQSLGLRVLTSRSLHSDEERALEFGMRTAP